MKDDDLDKKWNIKRNTDQESLDMNNANKITRTFFDPNELDEDKKWKQEEISNPDYVPKRPRPSPFDN